MFHLVSPIGETVLVLPLDEFQRWARDVIDRSEAFVEVLGLDRNRIPAPSIAMMTSSVDNVTAAEVICSALSHNAVTLGVQVDDHVSAGDGIAISALHLSDIVNGDGSDGHVIEGDASFSPAGFRAAGIALVKQELAC